MGIRKQYLQQKQKQQQLLLQNTKQQQIEKCSYYQQHIKEEQHLAAELEHHRSIQQSNQRIQKQRQKLKQCQEEKQKQKLEKEKSFQQALRKFPHEYMQQQQYTIEQQQRQPEQKDYDENQKEYGVEDEQQLYCKQYDALYNSHKIYKASKTNNANTTIAALTTVPPPTTTTAATATKQKQQLYHKWRSYANVAIKLSYFVHKILLTTTTKARAQELSKNSTTATSSTTTTTNTLKHSQNIKNKLFAFLLLLITVICIATTTSTTTLKLPTTITFETAAASTSALSIFATCSTTSSTSTSSTTTTTMAMLLLYLTTSATYVSGAIVGRLTSSISTSASASTSTIATRFQQAAATSLLPFHMGYDELTDTLNDNTVAVEQAGNVAANSNEQQLLNLYKRAQEIQQIQQQHHTYHYPVVDFDEMPISIADVVSTLSPADVHARRRAGKRAAPATTTTTTPTSTPAAAMPAASFTALSLTASTTTATTTTTAAIKEKCEPRVLDEVPTEPFYDFTDIAEDAARQFTEFLANKFPTNAQKALTDQMREEVRRRANGIASYALNEDDNLLAFAIAAPSIHTVVVKFRDNVTIPPEQAHNKAFLGSYWRELGYAWNSSDGTQEWGAPFRDCNLLVGRWLWPFRISFAEAKIKIVAAAFIAADEDVCNDGLEEIFGRRHGCDNNTTFCLLTENKPAATRDVYTCICREGFYLPNTTLQGFRGDIVELSEGFDNYSCIPCPSGCSNCDSIGVCLLAEPEVAVSIEYLLNAIVSTVLAGCILCCKLLSGIVFRQRKSKAIASGMWLVLETILLGIALLYASVSVHLYPASTIRCLLEPWLRALGFIICYGAIILKLYRHLVDFRTRKAHRLVLRDVDLLKYLGVMVFAVICYMAAFTASSYDLLEIAKLESLRENHTNTCRPLTWEYVTQASEICILAFGLQLAIASRNANTQFRERQFLVTALVVEFLVSTTFYSLRFLYLNEMSPGAIFLALFLRSQLTNTVCLALIFVPKLWYQHKQVRSLAYDLSIRLPVDAFKGSSHDAGQRLGGGYAGLCLGDPDIGELTIAEMSPEDIRAELKRLYTQLEILKNKSLRQDNPHISKRRGGRKAGHRRFSLQALSAKHRSHKQHQDIEVTEAEPSRTPEDSVCSAEGPTDTFAEVSGISQSMLSHSVVSHSAAVAHSK